MKDNKIIAVLWSGIVIALLGTIALLGYAQIIMGLGTIAISGLLAVVFLAWMVALAIVLNALLVKLRNMPISSLEWTRSF